MCVVCRRYILITVQFSTFTHQSNTVNCVCLFFYIPALYVFMKDSPLAPDEAGCSLRMRCDSCCNRILPKTAGLNQMELAKVAAVVSVGVQIFEIQFDSD